MAEQPSTSGPLVVVVDDSATNRLHLAQLLEVCGYQPACHACWPEAESALSAQPRPPAALILDCWLAREEAASIIGNLRSEADWKDRPILVIADPDDDRLLPCLEAGASDLLIRPIQADVLRERLLAAGVRPAR